MINGIAKVQKPLYLGSLVARRMWTIGNSEMLSTSNIYDGNVIYMVWKDNIV